MKKTTMLRKLISSDKLIQVIGANDGLTAILTEKNGFDALWASGLAISTSAGVPDASILTMTEFLNAASYMNKASNLPVIADCDTGFGGVNNIIRMVSEYEAAGIAGVCIEDKNFPKRNSFLEGHELADMHEFSAKIRLAKSAQKDPDFVVIARLESLIAGKGMEDAMNRAMAYSEAGADLILVHSKSKSADEIIMFAHEWKKKGIPTPLVVVPTTYYTINKDQLEEIGIKMVIYANQLLRSAVPAMNDALKTLYEAGTTAPLEEKMSSVKEVFSIVKTEEIDTVEDLYSRYIQNHREYRTTIV
ncbi:phosphoenolpyruvate mutase [Paenibacillus taichungensis]|uniref:phosphoenolpyruvate mutase n=1 Tax=Paenibacillus taichungensis TaxID=484184 RepID=UPI0028724DF9|nr:phosphoenolpyruvate mutase [Paenibacillus taichungensis]MDR9748551.1 phosphoenolpyruvate mutase [Paenibacillus taichungensis]